MQYFDFHLLLTSTNTKQNHNTNNQYRLPAQAEHLSINAPSLHTIFDLFSM